MIKTTWLSVLQPQSPPPKLLPVKKTIGIKKTTPEPFLQSKKKLIAVIEANPCIKPKAACRILGWSGSKLMGVMGHYSSEIGYGLVIKNKVTNTDTMANVITLGG